MSFENIAARLRSPASVTQVAVIAIFCWIGLGLTGCGGDLESRLQEVRALQDVGQYKASIPELREILTEQPNLPEASYRLGLALVQTGERSRAIWPLQRASESGQSFALQAGQLLANIHLDGQDFEEALRVIDRLLEQVPDDKLALQMRAKAHIGARQFEAAIADTQHLVELHPDDYSALALHAAALVDMGRLDDAEAAHAAIKRLGLASDDPEIQARGCLAPAIFARSDRKDLAAAKPHYEDCLSRYPQNPFVLEQTESYFDEAGDPERATALYRNAVEKSPENLALRSELASRLRSHGQVAEAEALLREAADSFGSVQAWQELSEFYRGTGNAEQAIAAIDKVIELSRGGNDELRFRRADLLIDLGDIARAEEVAAQIREPAYATLIRGRVQLAKGDAAGALASLDEGIRSWPNNAAARYLAGVAARATGDIERAISELRESVRVDKHGSDAALVLAQLYFDRGDMPKALNFANNYLTNRAQSSKEPALRLATRALTLQGRFTQAHRSVELLREAGFERAALVEEVALLQREKGAEAAVARARKASVDLGDPQSEELLRGLAEGLLSLGRGADALREVDAALAHRPEASSLYALRGILLARDKHPEEALAAFRRAIELDPKSAAALGGLATVLATGGERAEATRLYDQAASLDPDHAGYAYSSAQLAIAAGDLTSAEERLRSIVKRHAAHSGARNDLAWLLAEKGQDLDFALALAEEASQLDPSPNVLDTLGWVYLKRGDAARAVEVLQAAAREQPESVGIREHLAEALARAGKGEAGAALLDVGPSRDSAGRETSPEASNQGS
jgi:tetratricopeptide (TPR) repeat protein